MTAIGETSEPFKTFKVVLDGKKHGNGPYSKWKVNFKMDNFENLLNFIMSIMSQMKMG
jgi:hypothetical protein